MVRQGEAGALLLSFPFVDLFLINTGMRIGPDPMHYFLPRCRWFLRRPLLLFPCLVYPFFLSSILRFLYHRRLWFVLFPFPT